MRFSEEAVESVIHRNVQLPDELRQRLERMLSDSRRNHDYLEKHRSELTEQYPDKWVAIVDGAVVACGGASLEVVEELDRQSISRAGAVVHFLATTRMNLIL